MLYQTEFSNDRIPLGYFITFRCYGSWLHGRAGSVDRFFTIRMEQNGSSAMQNAVGYVLYEQGEPLD
jgi:hypothetical protein